MFKNAIRTLGKDMFQIILETALGYLAFVLLSKMIGIYFAKTTSEVSAETDESTNSEED